MEIGKNIFLTVITILGVIYAFTLSDRSDIQTFRYQSRENIVSDESHNTWIPSFFPDSAEDIHVVYGVDPSFLILEYRVKNDSDLASIDRTFELVSGDEIDFKQRFSSKYWKTDVSGNARYFRPVGYEDYSIIMAVDKDEGYIWYSVR